MENIASNCNTVAGGVRKALLCCSATRSIVVSLIIYTAFFASSVWADPPTFPGIPAGRTVNIKTDFAAKGDNITDDTAAIQDAVDSIAAQGGGTIFFPEGIYIVNDDPTEGLSNQIWLKGHIRLLGEGGRKSILKMPAGTTATDRSNRRNRQIILIADKSNYVISGANLSIRNPGFFQSDIEIARLAFDLDNGVGRNAVRIYAPAINVRIHDCEGFQGEMESTGISHDGTRYDNHFFNMAAEGTPVDQGIQPGVVDVPENITIDHCVVKDLMQLTSDGGIGCRNLWIHHNTIHNPMSFGIAVTSTGPHNAIFEDILIEENTIESPTHSGIFVGENVINDLFFDISGITLHAMRRVTIRHNTVNVRSIPADGYDPNVFIPGETGAWGATAAGISLNSALIETRDFRVENNTLSCEISAGTSRQALRIGTWDFNWEQTWLNRHGGFPPTFGASAFDVSSGHITLPGHGLPSGVQIEFKPTSAIPLPLGLEAYRNYRVTRVDSDRFSVTLPSGLPVSIGTIPSGGDYQIILTPCLENFVIAGHTLTESWDWDAAIGGSTLNFCAYNNVFRSRFDILAGTHDNLSYVNNSSTGILDIVDCTLRKAVFSKNSWSTSQTAVAYQPGIVYITGPWYAPSDPWRLVEATFADNTFSTTASGIVPALWMNLSDWNGTTWPAWSGSAALELYSNCFAMPDQLKWAIEPRFATGWLANEGVNDPAFGDISTAIPELRLGVVMDASFERLSAGTEGSFALSYAPVTADWLFAGSAGITGNGSGFTLGNSAAPDGRQVAFIQMTGTIQQAIPFVAGTYMLSGQVAQRASGQQQSQSVAVYVDDLQVGTFAPSSADYALVSTSPFAVTGGVHVIKFVGQANLDSTLFLDQIALQATLPVGI